MGIDCVWVARNYKGVTTMELAERMAPEAHYPGGGRLVENSYLGLWQLREPRCAYHYLSMHDPSSQRTTAREGGLPTTGAYVVLHDGCRLYSEAGAAYRDQILQFLRDVTGDENPVLMGDNVWAEQETIDEIDRHSTLGD